MLEKDMAASLKTLKGILENDPLERLSEAL
jgi:hypothetical protein